MKGSGSDPWIKLRRWTTARIALGRTGPSLPTGAVLEFALAHALARDAVHAVLDVAVIERGLQELNLEMIETESDASDRAVFLRRPDFGRRLSKISRAALEGRKFPRCDLAIIIGDGLSAIAVERHSVSVVGAMLAQLAPLGLTLAPVVLARGARVALGDEIGSLLKARIAVVLIGERPGLSSPDSLGAYLTFDPRPGRTDAERNCVSNIRPAGLSYERAAVKLAWLVREALRRSLSGVDLKDESDPLGASASATALSHD